MALSIEIANQQKRMTLNLMAIRRLVQKILRLERVPAAHLSVVFVTDRKIHSLNRKYLHHNYPTDVLAFDLSRGLGRKRLSDPRILEGEIIISTDTACRQSGEFATTPEYETVLYLCHGTLHLLGYDDLTLAEKERMRAAEAALMGRLDPATIRGVVVREKP